MSSDASASLGSAAYQTPPHTTAENRNPYESFGLTPMLSDLRDLKLSSNPRRKDTSPSEFKYSTLAPLREDEPGIGEKAHSGTISACDG